MIRPRRFPGTLIAITLIIATAACSGGGSDSNPPDDPEMATRSGVCESAGDSKNSARGGDELPEGLGICLNIAPLDGTNGDSSESSTDEYGGGPTTYLTFPSEANLELAGAEFAVGQVRLFYSHDSPLCILEARGKGEQPPAEGVCSFGVGTFDLDWALANGDGSGEQTIPLSLEFETSRNWMNFLATEGIDWESTYRDAVGDYLGVAVLNQNPTKTYPLCPGTTGVFAVSEPLANAIC